MAELNDTDRRLIKRWRQEANANMKRIRKVAYHDQAHRVQLFVIASTLRRCANGLYQERRKESQ